MKYIKNNLTIFTLVTVLSVANVSVSQASTSTNMPQPTTHTNNTPPGLSIDGFVSIVLAAGAFFGVKSLRRKK